MTPAPYCKAKFREGFTDDDGVALELYRAGLARAIEPGADTYRASIQLAMAERYKSMGESLLAYEHACRANEVAKSLDDLELRTRISEFLLDAREPPD